LALGTWRLSSKARTTAVQPNSTKWRMMTEVNLE
jgi:hypothetical protein